jgi:hypothetical protein
VETVVEPFSPVMVVTTADSVAEEPPAPPAAPPAPPAPDADEAGVAPAPEPVAEAEPVPAAPDRAPEVREVSCVSRAVCMLKQGI